MRPDPIAGRFRRFGLFLLLLAGLAGCGKPPRPAKPVQVEPHVRLVKAERRTIGRTFGQPGFINAYEQTSIYPKVSGYIDQWNVDIGDRIKKDQVIARLFVPELDAEHQEKVAQVALDDVLIEVAQRTVEVTNNYRKAAASQIAEAKSQVNKYQANVDRWESEVKRLTGLVAEKVIEPQVLEESKKQLQANIAAREAARSTVQTAEATELARKSEADKAQADVQAARAKAKVARAAEQRLAALLSYTRMTAPYDGVVVDRNANTGDYVQPGEQSGSRGKPVYVVARTDKVRVYVDVPEMDASLVTIGTRAKVQVQARDDEEIEAGVTRTSWALQPQTRSLRAEIDLPNPGAQLLPGMYAYGRLFLERRNVRALPLDTVTQIGNLDCCYLYENGKAVQTPVQIGINDGKWIEVVKKMANGAWVPFSGAEEVIQGDLSELSDGQSVQIVGATPPNAAPGKER